MGPLLSPALSVLTKWPYHFDKTGLRNISDQIIIFIIISNRNMKPTNCSIIKLFDIKKPATTSLRDSELKNKFKLPKFISGMSEI